MKKRSKVRYVSLQFKPAAYAKIEAAADKVGMPVTKTIMAMLASQLESGKKLKLTWE